MTTILQCDREAAARYSSAWAFGRGFAVELAEIIKAEENGNVGPLILMLARHREQAQEELRAEIAQIATTILAQADCLDGYAEQSGHPAKPVPSVFHLQSSHFRDLGKRLAALTTSPENTKETS